MAVDERARHELHVRLQEVLGAESATVLMSLLPPVGWADVAVKRDLDQLADRVDAALHREIGALRTEFYAALGSLRSELRGEIGALRSHLQGEIASLRSESSNRFDALRSEFARQTRTLLVGMGGLVLTLATLAFAALRLA